MNLPSKQNHRDSSPCHPRSAGRLSPSKPWHKWDTTPSSAQTLRALTEAGAGSRGWAEKPAPCVPTGLQEEGPWPPTPERRRSAGGIITHDDVCDHHSASETRMGRKGPGCPMVPLPGPPRPPALGLPPLHQQSRVWLLILQTVYLCDS